MANDRQNGGDGEQWVSRLLEWRRKWNAARVAGSPEVDRWGLRHAETVLNVTHRELDRAIPPDAVFPEPRTLTRRFAVLMLAVREARALPASQRAGVGEDQFRDATVGLSTTAARLAAQGKLSANFEVETKHEADRLAAWLAQLEEIERESRALEQQVRRATPGQVTRAKLAEWREKLQQDQALLRSRLKDAALHHEPALWHDGRPWPELTAALEIAAGKGTFDADRAAFLLRLVQERDDLPAMTAEALQALDAWAVRHAAQAEAFERAAQEIHSGNFRAGRARLAALGETFPDLDRSRLEQAVAQCEAELASVSSLTGAAAMRRAKQLSAQHPLFTPESEYRHALAAAADTAAAHGGSGGKWLWLGLAAALVAGGAAWWTLRGPGETPVAATPPSQPTPATPLPQPAPAAPRPTAPPPTAAPAPVSPAQAEVVSEAPPTASPAPEPPPLLDSARLQEAKARLEAHEAAMAALAAPKPATAESATAAAVQRRQQALKQATRGAPYVNTLGMEFIPVPGARLLMARTETQVGQFHPLQEALEPPFVQTDRHPACRVTWDQAVAFCRKLSVAEGLRYRLPTDAEWSLAAGLGAGTAAQKSYPWGTQWPPPSNAGNYRYTDDGFPYTAPAGSFPQSALGFYDLGGNVAEWCLDGPTPATRYLRGGAFDELTSARMQSAARQTAAPTVADPRFGFRCVVELP